MHWFVLLVVHRIVNLSFDVALGQFEPPCDDLNRIFR